MVLVLRAAIFFFLYFGKRTVLYRIQTSKKKKKKKAKILVKQIFVTPGFLWYGIPKPNHKKTPVHLLIYDLHQTVTTITGLPKKKMITIFVHTECVRVHVTTLWTLQ